jgi:amino acid permease
MTAIEPDIGKKGAAAVERSEHLPSDHEDPAVGDVNSLKRNLKNRHMQMIAVGMYLQFSPNILTLT